MTVAELRKRMSTAEYVQWVALYNVEGREREDLARKMRPRAGRKR